jgi:hypothetical protein
MTMFITAIAIRNSAETAVPTIELAGIIWTVG